MLGIVVVSYNTAELTLACLESVAAAGLHELRLVVVDNGSASADVERLRAGIDALELPGAELIPLPDNRGFADGCNLAIDRLLADAAISRILLLNNDAELVPGGLAAFLACAEASPEADMFAARMHRHAAPAEVDSLGIALYASGLASNRLLPADPLLGPTGGLALYSRRLLETVRSAHGSIFDETFFCYAEDTDLALRALLLGFTPHWCDCLVALHHGQASSGGGFSDFVLYHGIRNSIWTVVKDLPGPLLAALAPLILVLHAAIVLRHLLRGKARVLWHLYRDALRGLPGMWRQRRIVQRTRMIGSRGLWRHVTPRFYDRAYLRRAWRELWQRPPAA